MAMCLLEQGGFKACSSRGSFPISAALATPGLLRWLFFVAAGTFPHSGKEGLYCSPHVLILFNLEWVLLVVRSSLETPSNTVNATVCISAEPSLGVLSPPFPSPEGQSGCLLDGQSLRCPAIQTPAPQYPPSVHFRFQSLKLTVKCFPWGQMTTTAIIRAVIIFE